MKLFALILAMLMMKLLWLPCSDSEGCKDGSVVIAAGDHHKKDGHKDACSPFCQCACCSSYSIDLKIGTLPFPEAVKSRTVPSYLPAKLIEISLPIWQPPQLAC